MGRVAARDKLTKGTNLKELLIFETMMGEVDMLQIL